MIFVRILKGEKGYFVQKSEFLHKNVEFMKSSSYLCNIFLLFFIVKQKQLRTNKAKRVALSAEEECSKLMFSLQLGLRLGVQKSMVKSRRNLSDTEDCRRESANGFLEGDDSPVCNAKPAPPLFISQVN